MKLTAILLCSALLQVSASVFSQTASLSLTMKNASIKEVLAEIEKNSNYKFLYRNELIDVSRKVDIQASNDKIESVLSKLFGKSEIVYKVFEGNLVVITSSANQAQQQKLTGKVTDATNGESIIGASIIIEGTSIGVATDADGKFSMDIPKSDVVLIVSYLGYNSEHITLNGQSVVDIKLVPDITKLEEVVVIGYGVTKKSDVTGSIGTVSSKNFEHQPVTDMSSALQGRAAGVVISNVSGAPGGDIRIRIRGANSINGGNEPLYVVDGMQLSSFRLNDLNPADIENMEILKDASATAIYGSRGANGVIMITTKKGKTEKAKVDFTANVGVSNLSNRYNLIDPVAYANEINVLQPGRFSSADMAKFQNGFGTDWQNEIFQTGKSQDYQLSVSGSTPKSTYYLSGRYMDQTGIVINSNYKRYSFHSNIDSKISNKLTLSAGAFLNRSEGLNNKTVGSLRGGVEQAILWSPTEPLYLQTIAGSDSTVYNNTDHFGALGKNPVANLKGAHSDNISNSAMLNTKLTYKICDFLTLDIVAGMDANLSETSNIIGIYADYSSATSIGANRQHNTSLSLLNSNILTFHKSMGKHDFTVTGVYEQSKSSYDYTYAQGLGSAFSEQIGYYGLGSQTDKTINSYFAKSQLLSYIGRASYSFDGKYLLTASYRADGSSKFPNNKWGYFPSFGLGWRLSDETFIRDLNLFSNFKLRGGYGVTGNHGVNPFTTIPRMDTGNFGYGGTTGTYSEVTINSANSNLKWEQTAQTDLGIDLGFFKNRLTISADYFNKQTKDLLLNVPIPFYWGGGTILNNVGKVENKGFEFVIAGVPVDSKDFTWTTSFNITSSKNKVLELGGGATFINSTITNLTGNGLVQNDMLRNIVGESMGTFWGNEFLGVYQESEAAEAAKYGFKPGDNKYLDIDNEKTPSKLTGADSIVYKIDSRDKKIIGHSMPKFSWSFDNTFRYKNWELNVFFTAIQGNNIINMDYSQASSISADAKTITNADVVSWTPENKNNQWPKLGSASNQEIYSSSKWVQDGSFIRLKNVSLSYRFPSSMIKGAPLRLSVSGQNLLTITKFKGFDPEATSGGGDDINQGVVSGAYPSARTITFSLQLNF